MGVFRNVHDPAKAAVIHLADERHTRLVIGLTTQPRPSLPSDMPSVHAVPNHRHRRRPTSQTMALRLPALDASSRAGQGPSEVSICLVGESGR